MATWKIALESTGYFLHAAATAGEAEEGEKEEGDVSAPPSGLPTRTRSSSSPPGPLASCAAVEAPTRPVPPRMTTRFLSPEAAAGGGGGRGASSGEEEEEEEALTAVLVE